MHTEKIYIMTWDLEKQQLAVLFLHQAVRYVYILSISAIFFLQKIEIICLFVLIH